MINDTISLWHKTARIKTYPELHEDIETETLIIGGGITGVTCAYKLSGENKEVVLIEAGGLCDGTTGNTTAKVTIQHDLIYSRLMKEQGVETAKSYAKAHKEALNFVVDTVKSEKIDCDLNENTAVIFAENEKDTEKLKKEFEAAKELSIDAEYITDPDFPKGSIAALSYHNQAVFHPVKYISALADAAVKRGAKIYCKTKAIKVQDGDTVAVTLENGHTISAKHVLMATQYPIYDGPFGFYFTRLYPKRDYGMAFRTEADFPDGSYINVGDPARSIRTHVEGGQRILVIVGETHPTARSGGDMSTHFDNLYKYAKDIVSDDCEIIAKWSAQDYDTPDGIPYIGRLHANSNIFVASGYKKWGMTSGTLAGLMTADMIAQGGSRYEEVFSPSRRDISGSLGTFLSEAAGWLGEFIKSKVEATDKLSGMHPGEGRIIDFEGERAGIYLDDDGYITIVDITCTHMTTFLNFNAAEKTWDCPAHGGRFGIDGRLLEGPPKHPLKVLFKGRYSDLIAEVRR